LGDKENEKALVQLELSTDEALVLFEFIARFEEHDIKPWSEIGEQQVVWRIEAQLEKALVEPFKPSYKESVQQARRRISEASAANE